MLEIKDRLSAYSVEALALIIIIQPILDVFSYFAGKAGVTAITTGIRFVMLVAVSLFGFIISDSKKSYGMLYAVLTAFWIIHAANSLRLGYNDPAGDFAEYLKLIQMPLWTFTFITIFKQRRDIVSNAVDLLALNFMIIVAVIIFSYIFQSPNYMYDFQDRGIQIGLLGWFGAHNTQSAIVSILVAPLLLWAYRKESFPLFCLTAAIGFGLLYFTGTRFAYYSAIIIAAAFIVLLVICERNHFYCIPLLIGIALLVLLMPFSPMSKRQQMSTDSFSIYQEKTDAIMGDDKDVDFSKLEEIPDETLEKITRVYTEVYGVLGVHDNILLGDLIEKFGVEKVMAQYNYSTKATTLYDVRVKKINYCKLMMNEQDFMAKLFGFEYANVYVEGSNVVYAPENDYSSLPFFYGIAGTCGYVIFCFYFIFIGVRALIKDFFAFLNLEVGVAAVMAVILMLAAQYSGSVLRMPNATVYLSFALGIVYWNVNKPSGKSLLNGRKSVVSVKKIG